MAHNKTNCHFAFFHLDQKLNLTLCWQWNVWQHKTNLWLSMSVRGSKHIFIYYLPHLFWHWNYMFFYSAVFNHKEHLFWDQRAVLNYCLPFREFCIVRCILHASCIGSAPSTHLLSASDGFIWRGPAKLTRQMFFFFFPQIYTLRIITSAYVPRRWFTAKRRFMKHPVT